MQCSFECYFWNLVAERNFSDRSLELWPSLTDFRWLNLNVCYLCDKHYRKILVRTPPPIIKRTEITKTNDHKLQTHTAYTIYVYIWILIWLSFCRVEFNCFVPSSERIKKKKSIDREHRVNYFQNNIQTTSNWISTRIFTMWKFTILVPKYMFFWPI